MVPGISLRLLSFAAVLFLFSCGETNEDDTESQPADTTTQKIADTAVQAIRANLKDHINDTGTKNITLLLSKEQRDEFSKDPQKVAEYRNGIADRLPRPHNWVNDYDDLFTQKQEDNMNRIIAGFEKESGMQIAVITLDTFCIAKEHVSDAGLQIFNTWGIGTKEKNDGLLIMMVKGYGYMRMNTGSGTQQIMSDQAADSIMRAAFFPSLKDGNFYKGTLTGLNAVISYLRPNTGKIK
jgi:uncharacterized protein